MKVAAYYRVSTEDQNLESQRQAVEAYCKAHGHEIVQVFEEKLSGTRSADRPAFQDLLAQAEQTPTAFDAVCVFKLDRFARSLQDLLTTLDRLALANVAFLSVKENLDLASPTGRLMVHILAAFAEFEAAILKERVKAGIAAAKARGQRLGRVPIKQAKTDKIRALLALGWTTKQIAKEVGVATGTVSHVRNDRKSTSKA